MQNEVSKHSKKTVIFHWLVGLSMITVLIMGMYMVENKVYSLYYWHRSLGLSLFIFAIYRLILRVKEGLPKPKLSYTKIEKNLSRLVQILLLASTILMPISGILMTTMNGFGMILFDLVIVAANPDPSNPRLMLPINSSLGDLSKTIHVTCGWIMAGTLLLHVSGAMKHHIIDRDDTLKSMLRLKSN